MNFKEALKKYESLKQEIKDLKEAIATISESPQEECNTGIASMVLTTEKSQKEKELLSFEALSIINIDSAKERT